MTTGTQTATEIFADARFMHSEALRQLEAGDIRDAAEKAWCATKRATDALVLAFTGTEPRTSGQTRRGIRALGRNSSEIKGLALRYSQRQTDLHGACFYDGDCQPKDLLEIDIRDTTLYIEDAERLAAG